MSYGQKHKKIQILFCDLSYVDVCISEGIVIDEGTCLLLPDEFNGYICADTTADGNCLYNAVSYFFIHENSLSTQLPKSQIGFGQSAVSKIVKRAELPANALTRDAIKLWIEKQTESKQGICGMIKLNNNIIKISFV
ncbi:hypothetical protein RhiirB3_528350 [Rhizophagus irregularis]|nr:hypothetical protein RhiirB3_528350 [Rhizophagus irregularis]